MKLSVLSWNVRGENVKTKEYLEHVLGWLKDNRKPLLLGMPVCIEWTGCVVFNSINRITGEK